MLDDTPNSSTEKTHKSRAAITVAIVALVIIACMIAAFLWGLLAGKIELVTKASNVGRAGYQVVCGNDLVSEFNRAMYLEVRNGSKDPDIDYAALKSLASKIEGLKDYKNDPTCQTLVFWSDIYNRNYEGAKTAYAALKTQYDRGEYANSDISGDQPLSTYNLSLSSTSVELQSKQVQNTESN